MNVDIVNDFFLIKKIMNKGYEKSICKIEIENKNQEEEIDNLMGTGFFCKIPSINKIFFITCHHNLEKKYEKLKKLILKFDYLTEENWEKKIELDLEKERIKILDKEFDFIAIEILEDDNIHDYITADESSYNKSDFKNRKIFISHFPKDKEKNNNLRLQFSLGKVNGQSQSNCMLMYSGWTSNGTAGAPILTVDKQELIAIHKGSYTKYNFEKLGVGYPMHLIIQKIKEEFDKKMGGKKDEEKADEIKDIEKEANKDSGEEKTNEDKSEVKIEKEESYDPDQTI